MITDEKLALTVDEMAKACSLSKARLYQLLNKGELAATRCGSRTLILADEAKRFLAALPAATFPSKRKGAK
jgi:excisionase family DNA binding protein